MAETSEDKNDRKGTFIFDNFAIILPFIVAIAVAVVFSAFPGLKSSINKTFDDWDEQIKSTHK